MKRLRIFLIFSTLFALTGTACSAPAAQLTESTVPTGTPSPPPLSTTVPASTSTISPSSTPTTEPTATPTPEPTLTPTPAVLPLEIVEWAEYPYANLADPNNTDTHVEVLFYNPNPFPVRLDRDEIIELRFVNASGETVYANTAPFFHIWGGDWILAEETAPLSACVCFDSSGIPKQPWESLELAATLVPAPDLAYTTEVEIILGEFFSLAEAHLGGDGLGADITITNTSEQVLDSIEMRITARDMSGKYVGVVISGSAVDWGDGGLYMKIQPGATGGGIIVSEIDYFEAPLEYTAEAIGLIAEEP